MNRFELSGLTFGRLKVLHRVESSGKNSSWLCRCDCGNEVVVRRPNLMSGTAKSCGCLQKEIATGLATTHGLSEHKLYKVWISMKYRCYNPKCHAYPNYGGRGISVCDEWLQSFATFYDWAITNGYAEGLSVDRVDTNGNYEPANCRWVKMKTQANNRRSNVLITINGVTKSLSEWAMEYGIGSQTVKKRVKMQNLSYLEALTRPLRGCGRSG